MLRLNESDLLFLGALRDGQPAAAYAREHGYSNAWAKWKSKEVRRKLGVPTIREAIAMSTGENETGVSRADFEKLTSLVGSLGESIDELTKRPADQGAQQQVRERELDVKDHARALGLSLDDVQKLKDEKDYDRFRKMQERLDTERAAALEDDDDDDDGGDERSAGQKIMDGLGGVTNRPRQ